MQNDFRQGMTSKSRIILALSIEDNHCIAGSDLTGRVFLAIEDDVIIADSLVLDIIGEEKSTIHEIDTRKETVRFLEDSWVLTEFEHRKGFKGHYEFPFQILIPPLLPASLKMKSGLEEFRIHYYLEVRLYEDTYQEKFISIQRPLILKSQPINYSSSPITIPLVRENLYGNWCSQVGSILMGLYTPTSSLSPLHAFQISFLALPLMGTEQIEKIEISIVESMTWRINRFSLSRHYDIDLWNTTIQPKDIPDPGIDRSNIETIGLYDIDETSKQFLMNYLHSLHFSVSALIRKDTYPSVKGRLITIQHFIRLRVYTPYRNPEIVLPIRIQCISNPLQSMDSRMSLVLTEEINSPKLPTCLPKDWNPIIIEPVFITRSNLRFLGSRFHSTETNSDYIYAEEVDVSILPISNHSYRIPVEEM